MWDRMRDNERRLSSRTNLEARRERRQIRHKQIDYSRLNTFEVNFQTPKDLRKNEDECSTPCYVCLFVCLLRNLFSLISFDFAHASVNITAEMKAFVSNRCCINEVNEEMIWILISNSLCTT